MLIRLAFPCMVLLAGCPISHCSPAPLDGLSAAVETLCDPSRPATGAFGTYADLCVLDRDPTLARLRAAVEDGRMGFDVSAFDACTSAGRPFILEDVFSDRGCPEAFVPQTPVGGACDSSFECIDGFCLRDDYARSRPDYVAGGCGVCVPRRDVGEPCAGHDWVGEFLECLPGLVCGYEDGTCHRPAPLGGECLTASCGVGLSCERGECVLPPPPSEAHDGEDCSTLPCAGGLLCSSEAPRRCRPPEPVALGARCDTSRPCAPGQRCAGRCVELRRVGESCGLTTQHCVDGADCRDGRCLVGSPLGGPCASQCADGVCIDGRCETPDSGTPCARGWPTCGELICPLDGTCRAPSGDCRVDSTCPTGAFCSQATGRCEAICVVGR